MQIRPEGLAAALDKRLPAAVWVQGDEPLLTMEAADLCRKRFRDAGHVEREVFTIDRSFKPEELLAQSRALSLFASLRMLEVRMAARPTREIGQLIAEVASQLGDDTRLLISSPRLDRKGQQTDWFQAFDAVGWVVTIWPIERGQLPRWIAERLAAQGQRASADSLALIAERVEGNLLAAHQEITKLGLLFPAGDLPPDQVREAVLDVARFGAFDVTGAMLAGDAGRALRGLRGLQGEGEPEPLVLWALADATRTLLRLAQAVAGGAASGQTLRELRVFPPRDRPYEQALRREPADMLARRLEPAMQLAADIDRMIKGLAPGDAWHAFERLVTMVAGTPVAGRPAHRHGPEHAR